jgi:hypothetical protein
MDGYGDQNRKGVRGRNCNQRVTEESVESQTASFASSSPSSFLGLDPRGRSDGSGPQCRSDLAHLYDNEERILHHLPSSTERILLLGTIESASQDQLSNVTQQAASCATSSFLRAMENMPLSAKFDQINLNHALPLLF